MKRLIIVILCVCFSVSLCSCGGDTIVYNEERFEDITFEIPSNWAKKEISEGYEYFLDSDTNIRIYKRDLSISRVLAPIKLGDGYENFTDYGTKKIGDIYVREVTYTQYTHQYYDYLFDTELGYYSICAIVDKDEFKYSEELKRLIESVKLVSKEPECDYNVLAGSIETVLTDLGIIGDIELYTITSEKDTKSTYSIEFTINGKKLIAHFMGNKDIGYNLISIENSGIENRYYWLSESIEDEVLSQKSGYDGTDGLYDINTNKLIKANPTIEPTVAPTPTPKSIQEPISEDSESTQDNIETSALITADQKKALNAAKSYLNYTNFSYEGLIDQLEYEEYSNEDAIYAADHCGADWNDQAVGAAKSYLEYTAFSYSGLISQLEYEKFTSDQATYGVDNCGADWEEQAVKMARNYLEYTSFSRDELIDQLIYEGFSYEQAEYGVNATDQ